MQAIPVLPQSGAADDAARKLALQEARRFHLGDPKLRSGAEPGSHGLQALGEDPLPALLHPFRDPELVRGCFPAFVPAVPAGPQAGCTSLSSLLAESCPQSARVLTDNLRRAERIARRLCAERGAECDAAEVLRDAGAALREELGLRAEQSEQLAADWTAMCAVIPAGRFVALDAATPLRFMLTAVQVATDARREAFHARIVKLRDGLRELIAVERAKDPASRSAEALRGSMGTAGAALLDPAALASVIGAHRGSKLLDPGRRARLEQAAAALDGYLGRERSAPRLIVLRGSAGPNAVALAAETGVQVVDDAAGVAAAARRFDQEAASCAALFRAVRLAELEIAGRYDPERHDAWLEALDWEGFEKDELHLVPRIAVVERADELVGARLAELIRVLTSGRPVQVIAVVEPGTNPLGATEGALSAFRFELGSLGVGLREVFVQQSTPARMQHLLRGFVQALEGTRAALHVVATGTTEARATSGGPWLRAGAAIESRAHPLFRYDPEAGDTWARRISFDGNPAAIEDWPAEELACRDAEGLERALALRFTFADYALLEPSLRGEFRAVPPHLDGFDGALLPVDEYLALAPADAAGRVPYVWVATRDGQLHRVAVSRRLISACRDRLAWWHTLQELAGLRSDYVREAVDRVRQEADTALRAQRDELQREHEQELARAREEAVAAALDGLARSLLELGPGLSIGAVAAPVRTPAAARPTESAAKVAPAAEVAAAPAPAGEAVAESDAFEEAWIDTPLCTSCNDCRNINPTLFVYDENKQARIADPRAGTYLQLVQAAEKCPARCIHPGLPLNRGEPNLDELMARAAPFNQ
ncbi:MAG: ferredoxin [Planctomycetes bacterium]|nr:ferredoxin [Planctomycetota bacterium]